MSLTNDLGLLAPLWIPAVAAVVVLLLTVAGGARRPAPATANHLVAVSLLGLLTALYTLHSATASLGGAGATVQVLHGAVVIDGVAVIFGMIAIVGALVSVLLAAPFLAREQMSAGEFLSLVLLSVVGMLIVVMAGDLMTLFIGIETMSLAVYVLAGYRRASRHSQEAALKYFVYGAFASGFILFGTALVYGEVGRLTGVPSMAFPAIARAFTAASPLGVSTLGWIGVGLILGGLAFKVAAVPFHMWVPDVYEGAPTPATGFMAVSVKAAAFAGLCRFVASTMLAGRAGSETTIQIFEVLAVLTMVIGNLLAIRQTQLKRMLAYSSIAHAGYLLVGVAAFVAKPTSAAIEGIGYYLLGYTVMTLGAFGIVLAFERRDTPSTASGDLHIERLAGVAHKHPALGLAMVVFMLSLAGVPPTAGFFGKLSLFSAAVEGGRVAVVIVAVLASLVGAYYYLRVLVVMYMRAASSDEERLGSPYLNAALWGCAALTLLAGLMPEPYLAYARRLLDAWPLGY